MRVGLIGNPLGHSFSPRLHRDFGTADYELRPLLPDRLAPFFAAREFEGVNVTIPYKRDVIPFMDELHPSAVMCGAVNTVVNRDGRITGYNTDIYGMHFALRFAGITLAGRHVVVLGSGGTSHTACALARREGAASVTVVSRSGEVTYDSLPSLTDTEVVINATPVGMFPNIAASPADLSMFPRLVGVFDAVFNPLHTRFSQQAKELGVPAGNGLLMLTAQAKVANNLFRGGDYSEPAEDSADGKEIVRVMRTIAAELTDIVLIGMPSSGKTTVGQTLAEMLGRTFVDTDTEIETREGMSIPDIFATFGEEGFRARERAVIASLATETGLVVATGGGAPLSEVNRKNLAADGFTVLVRRDLDSLSTEGRPLSRDRETLARMEKERMPVYTAFADAEVVNDGTPESCAMRIKELFYENFGDQRS